MYDGVTCTKMIREKYGPWPFIASMTANAFPGNIILSITFAQQSLTFITEDKENCLNAGMNSFLVCSKTTINYN